MKLLAHPVCWVLHAYLPVRIYTYYEYELTRSVSLGAVSIFPIKRSPDKVVSVEPAILRTRISTSKSLPPIPLIQISGFRFQISDSWFLSRIRRTSWTVPVSRNWLGPRLTFPADRDIDFNVFDADINGRWSASQMPFPEWLCRFPPVEFTLMSDRLHRTIRSINVAWIVRSIWNRLVAPCVDW